MREGEIDPFDKVAQEGSSLRRELIDVDEIFAQKVAQFSASQRTQASNKSAPAALAKTLPPPGDMPGVLSPQPRGEVAREQVVRKEPGLVVGNGQLFLAQAGRQQDDGGDGVRAERARPRLRNPKIYHLLDERGRVQGPLAVTDILRLYYKGVLGSGIAVVRRDSKLRIPVSRFVAALARQHNGDQAQQDRPGRGHHPALDPVDRVDWANGLRSFQSLRPKVLGVPTSVVATAMVIAAIFLGAAAAWLVLGPGLASKSPRRERSAVASRNADDSGRMGSRFGAKRPAQGAFEPGVSGVDQRSKSRPSPGTGSPRNPAQGRPTLPARPASPTPPRSQSGNSRAADHRAKSTARFSAKRPPKADPRPPTRMASPRPRPQILAPARPIPSVLPRVGMSRPDLAPARPLPSPRPPLSAPVPTVAPRPPQRSTAPLASTRVVAPPTPRVAPPPAGNPGTSSLNDGQTVSGLGPFTFDRPAVLQCQAACTVAFKGPMGLVTGKFFKSIWGPILLEKNGPVRLSGLIRKSGSSVKIIISDIQ